MTKVIDQFQNKLSSQMIEQVEVGEVIGSGAHAKVHRALYLQTAVALKVYNNVSAPSLNAFNTELEAYSPTGPGRQPSQILSHPRVVQLLGAYQQAGSSYIITELSEYGTLQQQVQQNPCTLDSKMKIEACI